MTTPPSRFRWPAEWEHHDATWLAWPHNEESWPGKFERIPPVFAEMVRTLVEGETVRILVQSDAHRDEVRALLADAGVDLGAVEFFVFATDDAWIRDYGPIFIEGVEPEGQVALDWDYNAWGGKYPPWDRDAGVAARIAAALGVPRRRPGMVLEGGSVDGDGEGTVLTTEQCLLHPNRNPSLDRVAIEHRLKDFLGVEQVLWLGEGIVGDDTDGHVDDIARFVAPGVVLAAEEPDPEDPNHGPLAENLSRLNSMSDARGLPLEVRTLPMPAALFEQGCRLPASYANFYVGNEAVLVPVFADPADARALEVIGSCFPGRRTVGIDARDLVWGLGAFHCLTQQQPGGA